MNSRQEMRLGRGVEKNGRNVHDGMATDGINVHDEGVTERVGFGLGVKAWVWTWDKTHFGGEDETI
jgi:hypothetical protein